MRIGIVIDSACDLSPAFLERHALTVLPITLHLDEETMVDDRDPSTWRRFLDQNLGARGHAAETEAYSVEQIRELFLGRLVLDYDCVFCLTIASSRSPIHANASQAAFSILKDYRPIRHAHQVPGPFLMRVIDTGNLFAAQAVTAIEAVRLRQQEVGPGQMRERLEFLAQNTFGYMLPRDLYYLRSRAQKKGDRSVGWLSATLGTALDIKPLLRGYRGETGPVGKARGFEAAAEQLFTQVRRRVEAGLLTPTLCVSYGGDLAEMRTMPGYGALRETCAAHGVELHESPMSMTGMINVGTGAITLGLAAAECAFAAG